MVMIERIFGSQENQAGEPQASEQRSLENPTTTLADPAAWLFDAFGVQQTSTGVPVGPRAAMTYGPFFACVYVIAEDVGSLPLKLFERLPEKGRKRITDHRLSELFTGWANPETPAHVLNEYTAGSVASWGNGYQEILRNGRDDITGLMQIPPARTTPKRERGVKVLDIRTESGRKRTLRPGQYVHVLGFMSGDETLMGFSRIGVARRTVALGIASEEYGSKFFGQGAQMKKVLTHPERISQEAQDRLLAKMDRLYGGLENSHKMALLEEGMGIEELGMPHDDAQFLETRGFQAVSTAQLMRVKPHKIGILDQSSTRANLENQGIEHVVDTLRPYLIRMETAYSLALLTERERRQGLYFKFEVDALLRGDTKSRWEAYNDGFSIGALSQNDIREMEEKNPIDGGDRYFVPLNMLPADMVDEFYKDRNIGNTSVPGEPTPSRSGQPNGEARGIFKVSSTITKTADRRRKLISAQRRLIERAASHYLQFEAAGIERIIRAAFKTDKPIEEFFNGANDYYRDLLPEVLEREIGPLITSIAELVSEDLGVEIGGSPVDAQAYDDLQRELLERAVFRHIEQSQEDLRAGVEGDPAATDDGDDPSALQAALLAVLAGWRETRPESIAKRQAVRFVNALAQVGYSSLGVRHKVWSHSGSCQICAQLDGRTVHTADKFANAGDVIDPQDGETSPMTVYQGIGHPPAHRGCHNCVVVAATADDGEPGDEDQGVSDET